MPAAVTVTVSVPIKPVNVPLVITPTVLVALYALDAILAAVILNAFAVIVNLIRALVELTQPVASIFATTYLL